MSLRSLKNQTKRTRKKITKLARRYRQDLRRNDSGNLKRNYTRPKKTRSKSQEEITRRGLLPGDIGEDTESNIEEKAERSDS